MNRRRLSWSVVLVPVLTMFAAAVQPVPDRTLSLDESVRLALNNSPALLSLHEDVNVALQRVREEMGLTNVKAMIPFCRTVEEGERVIGLMAEFGLKQGEHELEIYAMCELPANVVFADEFLRIFDGYSIGSNDLTQLTLGLDRDSEMVAHLFDERNGAVEKMVEMAIDAAHRAGKKIGICGQAPSDYPEFARFLVEKGITSISLNPDTVIQTTGFILGVENEAV